MGVRAEVLSAPVALGAVGTWRPTRGGGVLGRAVETKGGDRFVRWVHAAGRAGSWWGTGRRSRGGGGWRRRSARTWRGSGRGRRTRSRGSWRGRGRGAAVARAPDGSGAEGLRSWRLEAACVGVPAVGTGVGGLPEAVGPAGLVVTAPDEAAAAVAAIRAWWTPEPGAEARAWCAGAHGTGRTVDALEAPAQRR
ncbi:MAG: hypothetical protein R3F59_16395 [Myxococcota bacterium]